MPAVLLGVSKVRNDGLGIFAVGADKCAERRSSQGAQDSSPVPVKKFQGTEQQSLSKLIECRLGRRAVHPRSRFITTQPVRKFQGTYHYLPVEGYES